MTENAENVENEVKPIVGHCLINGFSYALPINEHIIIERCARDEKYINERMAECEPAENPAKIVVGLSKFFNTDNRTQLFSIEDPEDNSKKILIIRLNGDFAVFVYPDFECTVAGNASMKSKYNSFVFDKYLKYGAGRKGEKFTVTLKKSDRFYGTIKEYFTQYGCCFDMNVGEFLMEML